MVFLTPFGQVLVLSGVHFTVYRIIVILGLLIGCFRNGRRRFGGGYNSIDTAFILCAVFTVVTFSVQWTEVQALIKSLGNLLDALGGYIVVRLLIQDDDDVEHVCRSLAVIVTLLAVFMTNEQISHKNVFGLLGGPPLDVISRDGEIRSMGPFEVYITAGVFGATLLPLFIQLWASPNSRLLSVIGVAGSTLIALTSHSSTPLLAYAAAIIALCLWPLRRAMRTVRWGLVVTLLTLHLVMKAPVWALIQRIDLTGSSSGFHRYMLVDQCIRHFGDWWLIGSKDYDTWGFDMWDLSNQYVACAVTGGLITLVTFILVISRTFARVGTMRTLAAGDRGREWYGWCLGAAVFSHVVAYFGIGYFDQIQAAWYTLLGIISVTASKPWSSPGSAPAMLLSATVQGTERTIWETADAASLGPTVVA